MIIRRFTLALAFLTAIYGLGMGASTLTAQPYPNRTIQLVIPGSPGLMLDLPGRLISEEVGKLIK